MRGLDIKNVRFSAFAQQLLRGCYANHSHWLSFIHSVGGIWTAWTWSDGPILRDFQKECRSRIGNRSMVRLLTTALYECIAEVRCCFESSKLCLTLTIGNNRNVVYRSETIMDNLNPLFNQHEISLEELCYCNLEWPLRVTIKDWQKNGKHRTIGMVRAACEYPCVESPSKSSYTAIFVKV